VALQETKFRIADRAEMGKLASERARIEAELVAAGGGEYGFLLGMCGDLSDIIKDIDEIARKKSEKERAAFETKVKFSRKVRRKAKDLGRFEKEIVQQFEEKHITLDHGRKMAEIVKLLKSGKPEKARHDAAEFLGLIGKGERLNEIDEEISRQKSHLEKKKRFLLAQISDLEWLEAQQEIDEKKVQRHEETIEIRMKIGDMRAEHIRSLKFMPFAELIKKAKSEGLEGFGFPSIDKNNAESLIASVTEAEIGMAQNMLNAGQGANAQQILQRLHGSRTVSPQQKKWAEDMLVKINKLPAEAPPVQPHQPLPNAVIDGQPVSVPQPQLPDAVVEGVPVILPNVAATGAVSLPASPAVKP